MLVQVVGPQLYLRLHPVSQRDDLRVGVGVWRERCVHLGLHYGAALAPVSESMTQTLRRPSTRRRRALSMVVLVGVWVGVWVVLWIVV